MPVIDVHTHVHAELVSNSCACARRRTASRCAATGRGDPPGEAMDSSQVVGKIYFQLNDPQARPLQSTFGRGDWINV